MPLDTLVPEPVIELLHGVAVADPYRWLEDRTSAETRAWIAGQQQRHDDYFSEIPGYEWLRNKVSGFLNVEESEQPTKIGNRYFYRRRMKDQEQACICVREGRTGAERILVDLADHDPFVAVAINRVSSDGSLLAFELRHGGSDMKAIHVVSVENGRILADHLEPGYARGFAFAPGEEGFYYCHESVGATEPHTIRFHRFGETIGHDTILLRVDRSDQSRLVLVTDDLHLFAILTHPGQNDTSIMLYRSHHCRNKQWISLPINERVSSGVFVAGGCVFAIKKETSENEQIVRLVDDGAASRVIVPACNHEIQCVAVAGENIYVSYRVNRTTTIRVWTLAGEYKGTIESFRGESPKLLSGTNTNSDSLFYISESFAEPQRVFEYRLETREHIPWNFSPDRSSRNSMELREVSYCSKDGTKIPMSLVMRSDLKRGEARPVILTSYGGFGVSTTPKFSVLATILVELGVLFAFPSIRGGSEFGKAWHESARARNRQVSFDDFIAGAEWLYSQGITAPHMLAILGGSNAGLLVGAAMTQRPEMFRAVVCIAPLLDMVRYEHFDSARKWRHEFGTAEEAGDFEALYAYSPYHNIRDNVNYPSTLFVSGDKDDRCNPAHVRKMAALLQSRRLQSNPILVDYSEQRGHCPALPLSVRIESLARRIAFLCHELGIKIPLEEPDGLSDR
jgi:prolyl oligopeptidase